MVNNVVSLGIRHQKAILSTEGILEGQVHEARDGEGVIVGIGEDLSFLWEGIFPRDTGFGWRFFLVFISFSGTGGQLASHLVPA